MNRQGSRRRTRAPRQAVRRAAAPGYGLFERFLAWARLTLPPGAAVTVGLSGGIDSVVLLDLLWRARDALGLELHALHVHHGLSPNAGDWAAFCRRLTVRRRVPLQVVRVDISPYRERGLEGAAREARYGAFAQAAPGYLALAHHADDQAETFLLQLLRGAGPAGLAGMPELRPLEPAGKAVQKLSGTAPPSPVQVVRPLLDVRRAAIAAYARARRLRWVEDESNEDTARLRNAIRHDILPRIEAWSPGAVESIHRSARLIGDAAGVVEEVAAGDLALIVKDAALSLQGLLGLTRARAVNALRFFLERAGMPRPGFAQTGELWSQLTRGRADANVAFAFQGWVVRRYRGAVLCEPAEEGARSATPSPGRAAASSKSCAWDGSNPWRLREPRGLVVFAPAHGSGIRSQLLSPEHRVEVRGRDEARVFRPQGAGRRRLLKKLFQEANIPSWQRSRLPYLYIDEALSWIPGIGVAADLAALPGEPGWEPQWWPDPLVPPQRARKAVLK